MSPEKPTLPSIQLMLEGAGIDSLPSSSSSAASTSSAGRLNKATHRRNASDVIGNLENLSLSTPLPVEPNANSTAASASTTNWPTPFRPTPLYQYPFHNHHRSARNLHSRSFSDYTHPYVTTPPAAPTSTSGGLLAPYQQQHRRAISTTTVDQMMSYSLHSHHHLTYKNNSTFSNMTPPSLHPSLSTSTLPQSPTLSIKTPSSVDDHYSLDTDDDHYEDHDDDSDSYGKSHRLPATISANAPTAKPMTARMMMVSGSTSNITKAGAATTTSTSTSIKTITSSTATATNGNKDSKDNNKYQCPYCQKGFSRPSSLRIHTYSHTGEKPFTCPEPNCDRSFSVQSNMRRHIRVHKLNGRHLKMRRSPPPIKPLAAKPSWMHGSLSQDNTLPLH